MKNKIISNIALFVLVFTFSGCTYINEYTNSNSNKTLAEKAVNEATGEKKIGIKECDDLMDDIATQNKSKDDNIIKQAAREYFLNEMRDSIRKKVEENKKDPAKQAQDCKQYQEQFDKYFKENNANSNKTS